MFQRPGIGYVSHLEINDNDYYVTRGGLRLAYQEEVVSRNYQLTALDVRMLASLLGVELCRHTFEKIGEDSSALDMRVGDVLTSYERGPVDSFKICVDGPYFMRREAISLEPSGFIGFAGWADSCNERPFLCAFARWLDEWLFSPVWRNLGGEGGGRDE